MGTPVSVPVGKRSADQSRGLSEPPAGAAGAYFIDFADIDDGVAVGEAL
jgi:hypothetical protein